MIAEGVIETFRNDKKKKTLRARRKKEGVIWRALPRIKERKGSKKVVCLPL